MHCVRGLYEAQDYRAALGVDVPAAVTGGDLVASPLPAQANNYGHGAVKYHNPRYLFVFSLPPPTAEFEGLMRHPDGLAHTSLHEASTKAHAGVLL